MHLSTAEYLASLPGGADAYPLCQVRGGATALREFIDLCGVETLQALLPDSISLESLRCVPNTYWIRLTHWYGIMHAVRDVAFEGNDERFEAFIRTQMLALLHQPAMRALLGLCTPKMTVKATPRLFRMSYRGVSMSASEEIRNRVDYTLVHPPHLVDTLVGRTFVASTETVLDVAGGKSTHARGADLQVGEEHTRFSVYIES